MLVTIMQGKCAPAVLGKCGETGVGLQGFISQKPLVMPFAFGENGESFAWTPGGKREETSLFHFEVQRF